MLSVAIFLDSLTQLHSERPKLHRVLAILSAIGLRFSMHDLNFGCAAHVLSLSQWIVDEFSIL